MNLPLNTVEVAPENSCDICGKSGARYYNTKYYIHVCSIECLNTFIEGYNREIEDIARKVLMPDKLDNKVEKKDDL